VPGKRKRDGAWVAAEVIWAFVIVIGVLLPMEVLWAKLFAIIGGSVVFCLLWITNFRANR